MIKNAEIFRKELENVNEWWIERKVKDAERYPIQRPKVRDLIDEIKLRHISLVTGSRRVGKTIVLKHLIKHLIEAGTNPRNILYYSLENPFLLAYCDNLIKDIFDYWYENITKGGKKFLFLDEVHFVKDWYKWVKVIYDRYRDVKIFVSGSSSLTLQREASTYLKGRFILHELFPLSFREFLILKGKSTKKMDLRTIKKLDPLEVDKIYKNLKKDFEEYLLVGGFPEWFEVNDLEKWYSVLTNNITKRAIYEDVVNIYRIRNPKILESIFIFIVANQSKILSYEKINEVARLKHEILVNYLEYLKSSYLLVEILKFAGLKEQLKAKKKYLCIDQGLRNCLLSEYEIKENNVGFIIENVIGMHLYHHSKKQNAKVMYYRTDGQVDFVLESRKRKIPIEVKYTSRIEDKELKNVKKFMGKNDCKSGFVVTKDLFKTITFNSKKIFAVPAIVFCLCLE